MDKIPVIPPDPMEAAQLPVEGVDVPEAEAAERKQTFPENDGLTAQKARDAADSIEGENREELGAMAEAAQRGRTA